MPNLVGIWNPELTREAVQQTITKQLGRVRVSGGVYSEYIATFPGFGMALQDHNLSENGSQPIFSSDQKTALLLDGEINNASELSHEFSTEIENERRSPPEVAAQLIFDKGAGVAHRFNGL